MRYNNIVFTFGIKQKVFFNSEFKMKDIKYGSDCLSINQIQEDFEPCSDKMRRHNFSKPFKTISGNIFSNN